MPFVSDYNPATYVAGNVATFPPLPVGAVVYQPSMWWNSTGVGVMDGDPVDVGDRIYADGRMRLYGELAYGDAVFGNPPDQDWPPQMVTWLVWDASLPPDQQPPFPHSGCPYGTRNQYTPGQWRIVVEALFNDTVGSRTYGALNFGDDVYGDVRDQGFLLWHDVTRPAYEIAAMIGTSDGNPAVPVHSVQISFVDDTGSWLDFAEPDYWYQVYVGSPMRVGFFDPQHEYWPIVVGTVEQIRDEHDTLPRFVTVQAFGNDMTLSTNVLGWQRPAELTSARFAALMSAGGWSFGLGDVVYPTGDARLHADLYASDITVRAEIDRTVQSSGWFFDTDPWGAPRLREWPHLPSTDVLDVVDCVDDAAPDAVLSHRITYVGDQSQVLNVAAISNANDPTLNVRAEDEQSIARFGRRSNAMGFPLNGLAFADESAAAALVVRYVNRWSFVVRQVESFEADTVVDSAWLEVLAGLDTGRAVHVRRTAFHPFAMDGVIVGYTHMITPERFRSTINVATLTSSR